MRSPGEPAAVEERLFLRRGDAAEYGVAVREAAEAADDVGVDFRPFQPVGVADRLVKRKAALLIGEVFRVFEWQIKEAAQLGWHLAIEAAHQGAGGNCPRQWIADEGARLPAEHVARELIEQNEQRQRAFRVGFPSGEFAGGGSFVNFKEAAANVVVESGVLLEPAFRPRLAPERDHIGGRRQSGRLRHAPSRSARRRILPTLVFGRSSRNSMYFGIL